MHLRSLYLHFKKKTPIDGLIRRKEKEKEKEDQETRNERHRRKVCEGVKL